MRRQLARRARNPAMALGRNAATAPMLGSKTHRRARPDIEHPDCTTRRVAGTNIRNNSLMQIN